MIGGDKAYVLSLLQMVGRECDPSSDIFKYSQTFKMSKRALSMSISVSIDE